MPGRIHSDRDGGRTDYPVSLLQAAAAGVADITPDEGNDLQLWGVVTHVIKTLPT